MNLKDGSSVVEHGPDADLEIKTGGSGGGENEIRCPVCAWSPQAEDRWSCSCGHSWNTFETGGVCPNCMLKWAYTQCRQCALWSVHSDWYRYK